MMYYSYGGSKLQAKRFETLYRAFISSTCICRNRCCSTLRQRNNLKSIFARHGIPEVVFMDNGPQHPLQTFYVFSDAY